MVGQIEVTKQQKIATQENASSPEIITAGFKALFEQLNANNCREGLIEQVYRPDMIFEDSFHRIVGREAFVDYCESLYQNLSFSSFDFHDHWYKDTEAMLTWTMTYGHPRLNWGKPIAVEGATHIKFDRQVYFHKDYFDGGRLLYENIPLLGSLINTLKKRLL